MVKDAAPSHEQPAELLQSLLVEALPVPVHLVVAQAHREGVHLIQGGKRYDGRLCFFTLSRPTDAYEWSFVAVPAQRKAGVIKAFGQEGEGDLKRLLAGRPGYLKQLEVLEKEAQLGRSYMEGLRKELVRLAGLADEALDLTVFLGTHPLCPQIEHTRSDTLHPMLTSFLMPASISSMRAWFFSFRSM